MTDEDASATATQEDPVRGMSGRQRFRGNVADVTVGTIVIRINALSAAEADAHSVVKVSTADAQLLW